MLQGRLTAKIAVLTAVCSLGVSSMAMAAGDQPAPAPDPKPDGDPEDARTSGTESCDDTIGQVCDGGTDTRPVLRLASLPR